MSRPLDSIYRRLFKALPDTFKEGIELIYRDPEATRDDYGHPTYHEVNLPVRARVEMLKQEDRTVESGGIRQTRQAKVYLPIASEPLLFFDAFSQTSSVLDPVLWYIRPGLGYVSPVVANGIATYGLAHYGEAVALMDTEVEMCVRVRFRWDTVTFPGEVLFGLWDTDGIGGNCILVWRKTGIQAGVYIRREYGPPPGTIISDEKIFALDEDWHEVILERTAERLKVYLDDVVIWNYTGPALPVVPFYFGMYAMGNPDQEFQFDHVIVSRSKDDTNPIRIQDQVLARERRWALIQEPLITHLQQELVVQEVIPDG